jgi:hypothetical protein
LTDPERSTLAVLGRHLGRQRLKPAASAAKPDTILAWFRKLVAQQFDGPRPLQVRVRGQIGPACQVTCTGLAEAIHFGQSEFPAFSERNPWIGLDSLQQKIWILLDPATESTR